MKLFNFLLIATLFSLSAAAVCAQTVKTSPLPADSQTTQPVKLPEVRDELLKRLKADQAARIELAQKYQGAVPASAMESLAKTDEDNAAWIKQMIEKHGWLGKSLVGGDGAQAAFLLVQHAAKDLEFQKKSLELLQKAVKDGDAQAVHLAYLTDRVRLAEGKPQVYGTQTKITKEGKFEVPPIEDEANVDKRRAEVGLEPLADYIERMRQRYSKPD